MMRGIIATSLQFRFLVLVLAAALIAFGVARLPDMPVDVLPEFSPPYVEIQTEALGLSAEEVEQMITVPMEQDLLAGVAWLDVIRSESVPGLSSVLVYFEPGTNLYRARQMVAERIAQSAVGLPHVSKPPTMIQPLSSASRFMIVGLSSKKLSLIEMSVLARWTIAPRLMGVPGVAHVAIWGNRDRQLQVQVDPEQLQERGVSLQQVVETTGNSLWVSSLSFLEASTPGTGGFIDTPQQRLGVWHVLPISSPEELAQVPVERTAWRLGDVANVVEDHQPLIGDAIINESPNLLLVIEKLPGVNTLEVTRGVEAALDVLRPGFADIEFAATLFRPATFIEMAIANLSRTLLISALLIVLTLFAFLWSWRVALISLVAIPLSLLAAMFVLYQRGAILNVMVLAGLVIALGAVIDDAIIDVDRIAHRLRQNRRAGGPKSAESVILEASAETRGAIFFATLITLLVVLPIFFMAGVSGALFRPLVVSYVLAVLAALAVALTITPALSLILLSSAPLERRQSPLIPWLQRGYESGLAQTAQRPRLAYAAVAVLMVAGLVLLPFLGRNQLLPSFREPYLTVQLEAAPGTSLPAMNRIVAQASSELRAIPGVSNVAAHVGRAVFGDRVVGVNSAELWVSIRPEADYDATIAAVQRAVDAYTGLDRGVQTYLQQTLGNPQTRASDTAITVRVFGENHDVLRGQAEKLQQTLAGIDGVVDPRVVLPVEEPTLEIEVDLASAQRYGVKPGDVRRSAATLLSGIQVGSLFEQQKVFDVVVWGVPEIRDSPDDVGELLIDTPRGGHVRLKVVADVRMASSPTVIKREGVSPYLDIGFNVQGRDAHAVASDVRAVIQNYPFPLEYHAEVLSDFAVRQATQQRILIAGIVALVGIFLLLQASSGSWHLASAIFLTSPTALAGGVLAALLGGGGLLSLGVLAGFLTIVGITLRNSTMLISHYQYLEEQEGESFGPELILRGAQERLSPILLTTLTTGLALLPFVLFGNIPGHEIVRPIAIVVLGGLVTSTLFNLFIVPALYLRFGSSLEPATVFSRELVASS
ncbi:MAG: efflux RND transporter permease subunit [Ardenticatenaceae bacterium]|nr:efflux RND transporter permease subunit [Ardenticatenaceae bacterium]